MYPALIKRQLIKPSALHITRLSRASVHGKSETNAKSDDNFFINTTYPDDLEASTLNPVEYPPKQSEAAKGHDEDPATAEQHKADIYESIFPKEPKQGAKSHEGQKMPSEPEREPNMDEL